MIVCLTVDYICRSLNFNVVNFYFFLMPQFDIFSFSSQITWTLLSFCYILFLVDFLIAPTLTLVQKSRNLWTASYSSLSLVYLKTNSPFFVSSLKVVFASSVFFKTLSCYLFCSTTIRLFIHIAVACWFPYLAIKLWKVAA